MPNDDLQDNSIYEVVMNHEEQYSIWPSEKPLPLGWKTVGWWSTRLSAYESVA
jgi:MbtH protein